MDGGAIAGSSGSDDHVVYLDIPQVVDLDPRVLCDRRDRQVCDGDALRVVEQQALDTHSRSPDDSQSMSGARANHQFTFIVVAEELDRSALRSGGRSTAAANSPASRTSIAEMPAWAARSGTTNAATTRAAHSHLVGILNLPPRGRSDA